DDGGAARRAAAGAGHRHGVGAAPAARHRDRRRVDLQPNAHALHDARRVPLPRPPAPLVRVAPPGWRGGTGPLKGATGMTFSHHARVLGALLCGAALCGVLTSCAVGPDYQCPDLGMPAAYRGAATRPATQPAATQPALS